jgi:hypothetical protein
MTSLIKNKPWIRFGCFITGWNYSILQSCSEASFKALKKYTSSMLILMIIWSFVGYCFAERYISAPWWGCLMAALILVIIVVQIERQVILTVGKNKRVAGVRILIAIIMAIIGSAILDQIIFKEDIGKKMLEIRADQVLALAPIKQRDIQFEINRYSAEIDSVETATIKIQDEIDKRPIIYSYNTSQSETPIVDAKGESKNITSRTVSKISSPNPRIQQVTTNYKLLEQMRSKRDELTQQKMTVSAKLEEDLAKHTGFLEELRAIFGIMADSGLALGFYAILFLFLFSLELLVLMGKYGDKDSDYEMVIMHQLNVRKDALEDIVKKKNNI